jgi:hypothetical protein
MVTLKRRFIIWLAEVLEVPGLLTYGRTKGGHCKGSSSILILADRLEHGEAISEPLTICFDTA